MTPLEMVREFHEKFGCDIDNRSSDTVEDRICLIHEEWEEVLTEFDPMFFEAEGEVQWDLVAKELADLVYVVYGAAVNFGIDLDKALELVHTSNMGKLWPDGRPRYEPSGKVSKPLNYKKPDMSETVKELK